MPGIPRDDDGPVFREPWEAQAFAMALALHERGLFTWNEWAAALADEIKRAQAAGDPDTGETYYRHWLATLENLVAAKGVATTETLHRYRDAWDHAADRTPHGSPIELTPEDFGTLGRAPHIPASPSRATRRPGIRRSHNPNRAARRARRDNRCGSVRGSGRPALPRRAHARASRCEALSSHISGVCSSKFFAMPRLSADCSALMVSSRQSG